MWDDARVALLKKLWGEGLSASQIAARIGGVTRNAVISKIHRLGLSGRSSHATTSRKKRKKVKPPVAKPFVISHGHRAISTIPVPVEPYVEKPAPYEPPVEQRVTMEELESHHCKFPTGDPREDTFRYCGGKRLIGAPYCEPHCRIAFAGPKVPSGIADRAARFRAGWRSPVFTPHPSQESQIAAGGLPEPEKEDA